MSGPAGSSQAHRSRVAAEVDRLTALFEASGATRIEADVLQSADVLLDLYGEDIRARAFVTRDQAGELMLRPDFTVPVVQHHMAFGAEPARYAYAGPVWRRQTTDADRAREYLQVGFELFTRTDPAEADAEVFALVHGALKGRGLSVAVGDMGLLLATIDALQTTDQRKAALRRHLWRPGRFHRLLDRFSTSQSDKTDLLEACAGNASGLVASAGKAVGKRRPVDVVARLDRLATEAQTPPLGEEEVALIEALLDLNGPLDFVAASLRDLTRPMPAMLPAVERFNKRTAALAARGIELSELMYEGAYGRTTLEYYDGFVFGFFAADCPGLPGIASGGRYDALTRAMGNGVDSPAVGAIIRPEVLIEARP